MRYYGVHASANGGLANSIKIGDALGVNAIQSMFSAPMRWSIKDIDEAQIKAMAEAQITSTVKKMLFHGVYLTNLARQEKAKFHMSKLSQMTHLAAAQKLQNYIDELGGDGEVLGVTFHPGSALDCEPADGLKRISEGLNWILDELPGKGKLLLETSAGAGNVMGDKLEELAEMRAGVEDKSRVAYVIDTQHMFVSGYDWRDDLEGVITQLENTIGIENIKAIHLNDSAKPLASHRDRHADLGQGEIGEIALRNLVNHPKLVNIPFLLETPAMKDVESMVKEVAVLKGYIKE